MKKIKRLNFSADMALANYQGIKDQTRRLDTKLEVGDIVRQHEPYYKAVHGDAFKYIGQFRESQDTEWKYIPTGRYMRNEHARIYLLVTEVRQEKLDLISEYDAIREGVLRLENGSFKNYLFPNKSCATARESYISLWDKINAKGEIKMPFKANPTVSVITYTVITRNGVLPEEIMEVLQNG